MTIKVENLLTLQFGRHSSRTIYPYFSEEPILSEEGARIGLWAMNEALEDCPIAELQILDVFRGTPFSVTDLPLKGNERDRLAQMSKAAINLWKKLRKEYE